MEVPPFRLDLTAGADDIDELGHVGNQVYLRWVLQAALAHSAAAGWSHAAYRTLGGVFVVRRHELDYLAAVFAGDAIAVTTWVPEWRGASCARHTSIRRAADGHEVARAVTRWAFVEFATGRPRKIPDELRAAFAATITA